MHRVAKPTRLIGPSAVGVPVEHRDVGVTLRGCDEGIVGCCVVHRSTTCGEVDEHHTLHGASIQRRNHLIDVGRERCRAVVVAQLQQGNGGHRFRGECADNCWCVRQAGRRLHACRADQATIWNRLEIHVGICRRDNASELGSDAGPNRVTNQQDATHGRSLKLGRKHRRDAKPRRWQVQRCAKCPTRHLCRAVGADDGHFGGVSVPVATEPVVGSGHRGECADLWVPLLELCRAHAASPCHERRVGSEVAWVGLGSKDAACSTPTVT